MPLHQLTAWINFDLNKADVKTLSDETRIRWVPNKSEYFRFVGDVFTGQAEYNKAEMFYTKSLELNPNNSNIYRSIARFHYSKQEYESAIDNYKKAIKLDQNVEVGASFQIGLIYKELGEYHKAIEAFRKVLNLASENPLVAFVVGERCQPRYVVAQAHHSHGRIAESLGGLPQVTRPVGGGRSAAPVSGNVHHCLVFPSQVEALIDPVYGV